MNHLTCEKSGHVLTRFQWTRLAAGTLLVFVCFFVLTGCAAVKSGEGSNVSFSADPVGYISVAILGVVCFAAGVGVKVADIGGEDFQFKGMIAGCLLGVICLFGIAPSMIMDSASLKDGEVTISDGGFLFFSSNYSFPLEHLNSIDEEEEERMTRRGRRTTTYYAFNVRGREKIRLEESAVLKKFVNYLSNNQNSILSEYDEFALPGEEGPRKKVKTGPEPVNHNGNPPFALSWPEFSKPALLAENGNKQADPSPFKPAMPENDSGASNPFQAKGSSATDSGSPFKPADPTVADNGSPFKPTDPAVPDSGSPFQPKKDDSGVGGSPFNPRIPGGPPPGVLPPGAGVPPKREIKPGTRVRVTRFREQYEGVVTKPFGRSGRMYNVSYTDKRGNKRETPFSTKDIEILDDPSGPGEGDSGIDPSTLKKGMKLQAYWGSSWFDVTVLELAGPGKVKIHWDGYGDNWDKEVDISTLRMPK